MNEPNQKDQIESVLADLAVQEISERVPSLFDHYLGFELIDKNEDGTRAAGLLGFGIGETLLYVPILFLNGRIRGTEMIYLKDHDRFLALSKQWADFLINRNPSVMGAPDSYRPRGQVGLAQLQIFKSPQVGGKQASANFTFGEHRLNDLIKTALYDDDCDVVEFFKKAGDKDLYTDFIKWASAESPEIMEGLFRFYDTDTLKIAQFNKTAADLLMDAQGDDGEPGLVVVTDPAAEEATLLGEEETVDLMQTGIGIVDNRSENSVVVREENRQRIFNANVLGVYDMINADLEVVEVLVVPSPQPVEDMGTAYPGTLVYDSGSNLVFHKFESPINLEHERPPVMNADIDETKLKAIYDGASSLDSVQVNKTYILICLDTMQATAPFRVENKAGGRFRAVTVGESTYKVHKCCDNFPRPVSEAVLYPTNGVWIEEMTADGPVRPLQTDEALFLPKCWKVLPAKTNYEGDTVRSVTPAQASEINLALLTSNDGIKRASFNGDKHSIQPLAITKRGGDIVMTWDGQNGLFRKRASLIHALTAAVGLTQKEAREVTDSVFEKNNFKAQVKVAYDSQIDIPWPDLDDSAGSTTYSGTPQVAPMQAQSTGTIDQYDGQDVHDPETADFHAQMKRQAGTTDVVGRAAQSGVKQVFDPAMVSMLLRTNRVNMQVESEYLPILEKSVDRLCRMLLLFYWHNSDFADTYGQDDLSEFEDVLLTAIKNMGQLNLFLRQKAVGASASGIDAFSEAV